MSVKMRQEIERKIAQATITQLLAPEPKIVDVQHSLGSWRVLVYPTLTEGEYLSATKGRTMATSRWVEFKTPGLAIGWIKRLAKNSPDRNSEFHILPWDGKYSIYFG